jgi:(heptosyl)LPS beta-1,4-glucosyltransferase
MSLGYAVLTLNEAAEIGACLGSLGPAEEVLLLDSGSTDGTLAAARAAARGMPITLRVAQRPFRDYADQRNAALNLLRTDWVFFVDADERSSPEQAAEVAARIAAPDAPAGFWVPRANIIFGKRMHHTGWWPDYQLRLFQVRQGRYDPARPVHELVQLHGRAEHLKTPLVHYNYRRVGQFIAKQRRYARHEAQQRRGSGERVRPRALLTLPAREFYWRAVTLAGWRDGGHGLLLSGLMAWYRLLVAWETRRPGGEGGAGGGWHGLPPLADARRAAVRRLAAGTVAQRDQR